MIAAFRLRPEGCGGEGGLARAGMERTDGADAQVKQRNEAGRCGPRARRVCRPSRTGSGRRGDAPITADHGRSRRRPITAARGRLGRLGWRPSCHPFGEHQGRTPRGPASVQGTADRATGAATAQLARPTGQLESCGAAGPAGLPSPALKGGPGPAAVIG